MRRLTLRSAVMGLMLLAGCNDATSAPPAPAVVPGANLIQNAGFEQDGRDAPAGWMFEERVRSKGRLERVADADGKGHLLKLSPNAKNADGVHPLAAGQGFAIDPYRGKTLRLAARMRAEGGATAVVGLHAIRKDGSIAQTARLTQGESPELVAHDTLLELPERGDTFALVLSCAASGTSGAVFFDDVVVAVHDPKAAVADRAAADGPPLTAQVTVNAAREIRRIPRTLYGTNIEWIFDGYGLWDRKAGALQPDLVRLTRDLGVSLVRFPGGVFSDFYHWRDGVGPQATRRESRHVPGAAKSRHTFGTDEALEFAKQVGGELLITVNAGTGTAQEAADWIRYVNASGPRVTWWEVGNELYGDDAASKTITLEPHRYAERFVNFARAMRAADARIRIGAIGNESYGRYQMNAYPGWNRTVLTRAGEHMDFFAVHNAYAPLMFVDRGEDVRTVYAAMLAAPRRIAENLATVSRQIEQYAPKRADHIRLAVTEWGPWFHAEPSSRFVDHVKTLASGLFVAGTLKAFIEEPRMEVANAFKLVDNAFMGWIGLRDGKYVPKAPYYALQMFTRHFGSRLVESRATGPTYDSPAAGLVDAVRDVPYLEVVSSLNDDGSTLYVMAINTHFDRPIDTTIAIEGFAPATLRTWTLTGSGIDAHTGTELPKTPGLNWAAQTAAQPGGRFDHGGPDEVRIDAADAAPATANVEYRFGPHSVTCLEFRRAEAPARP